MKTVVSALLQRQPRSFWKRTSATMLASAVLLGGHFAPIAAFATPLQVSQQPETWNAVLNVARLVNSNKLVLQLNVLDKPVTSYANAVYMIYARRNGQWTPIFTSTGARLITNIAGQRSLAPEVIDCDELQQRLGNGFDLATAELKAVALLRYDVQGYRDQRVEFEQIKSYREIAQTTTTQLVSDSTWQDGSTQVVGAPATPIVFTSDRQERSSFSLSVLQKQRTFATVVARVSLKERYRDRFGPEQFIGDFRYKLRERQKAKFVQGLRAGDRVVVRLFAENRLIGYSEFELLSSNTAVTLVLPDRAQNDGIVRTIYGVDADDNYTIDRNTQVYDYFSQITQVQTLRDTRVTFLSQVQSLDLQQFDVAGLPRVRSTCSYPSSFQTGSFTLVNEVFQAFNSHLSSVFTTLPGQLVQVINLSSTNVSIYQVRQLIVSYQGGSVSQGTVVRSGDDDDRDDDRPYRKPHKQHCNQGRGNGSEGCDPGHSHPHGGSNDGD